MGEENSDFGMVLMMKAGVGNTITWYSCVHISKNLKLLCLVSYLRPPRSPVFSFKVRVQFLAFFFHSKYLLVNFFSDIG